MQAVEMNGHATWTEKIGTHYGCIEELDDRKSSSGYFICSYVDGELIPAHFNRVDSWFSLGSKLKAIQFTLKQHHIT